MSMKFSDENANKILEAVTAGDKEGFVKSLTDFQQAILEKAKVDYEVAIQSNDAAVMAQRGFRQLTAKETKWYQKVITALKSTNPKQAFTAIIGSDNEEDLMPTTIIEDVFKNLRDEHPLLKAINFVHVGYITKWVLNDHSKQAAVWGPITDEVAKEITSAFKVIDINQSKLSAFAVIEKGMLDLGPIFIDRYIRDCLKEALMVGLEQAIIGGNGLDQPIGLIKDIHKGVSVSQETGYPNKTAEVVADFKPATYGALVAKMAKTEEGKKRKFGSVGMIVNMTDYLTKIMPATTVLNANAAYVRDLFPFPTTVYISNEIEEGKAIMFLEAEYFAAIGGSVDGTIEYSDEYKFIEDQRVFKIKQYGAGRATDNTCALYLDISKLEPAFITIENREIVTA